jgi:cell division septation protein DedD
MSAFAIVRPDLSLSLARAACAVAVICVAMAAFGAAPAAAACGQTTQVNPRHAIGPGPPPLAVGDSVLYAAAPTLAQDGFKSNAMVCRTMAQGIDWLLANGRPLPPLVVVALGTNGTVSSEQIDDLLRILGRNRRLALVTPHHGVSASVPGLFRKAVQQHPDQILLLDWDRLSAGHSDWFAPDGIHLGGAAGIAAYAHLIATALAESPAASAPVTTVPATPNKASTPKPPRPVSTAAPARKGKSSSSEHVTRKLIPIHGLAWLVLLSAVVRAVTFSGS